MNTDETVISGATESISTIQRFEPAILQQQSYLPSIGVDKGQKIYNYYSTISSLVSDTPEETKSGFIEKHKRLLVWSGFIIAAVVVVKLI